MIDQHRDQIAHRLFDSAPLRDRIQQPALLLRRDRGILPHPPQIRILGQQFGDLAQFSGGTLRI